MVQGFGLMGLEAMACGVAAVLSDTGGVRQYATPENSLLCPEGQAEAFVAALESLVSDRELLRGLKRKGLASAQGFDWDLVSKRHYDFFTGGLKEVAPENYRAMQRILFRKSESSVQSGVTAVFPNVRHRWAKRLLNKLIGCSERCGMRCVCERWAYRLLPLRVIEKLKSLRHS
jgi:hypothetical protein